MKILWLTRDIDSSDVLYLKNRYNIIISKNFTDITNDYQLVIVSNYDKIVPSSYFNITKYGIVVIHSSDLPKGRGWAPIYNSIQKNEPEYVVSIIKIDEKVDTGNILLKCRLIKPKYINNNNLRDLDEEITIIIVEKLISLLKDSSKDILIGKKQENSLSTYYQNRNQNQNKLDETKNIKEQIFDILATNENYASFLEIDGEIIEILAFNKIKYKLKDLKYTFEVFI